MYRVFLKQVCLCGGGGGGAAYYSVDRRVTDYGALCDPRPLSAVWAFGMGEASRGRVPCQLVNLGASATAIL